MSQSDGGPAFPTPVLRTPENPGGLASGLTTRDWFDAMLQEGRPEAPRS